jgi:hypothetical protein
MLAFAIHFQFKLPLFLMQSLVAMYWAVDRPDLAKLWLLV